MWHGKRSRWDRIEERLHRALEICLGLILAVGAVGVSTVTLVSTYSVLRGNEQDRVGLTVLVVAILAALPTSQESQRGGW